MEHLLDADGLDERQFLERYDPGDYPRPSVTVDIAAFDLAEVEGSNYRRVPAKELRILLIRRGGHPYIGRWALPGGFLDPGETVGEAAVRELREETGIACGYLEQLHTFSAPGRDPRTWVISCAHMALIARGRTEAKAGSDATDARWFKVDTEAGPGRTKLTLTCGDAALTATVMARPAGAEPWVVENDGLAFDHAKIIAHAVGRLRANLGHTDLVFGLMPESFTLTELQQAYEAILGKPLYKSAFRRKVASMVLKTDRRTEYKGHRPAAVYVRAGGRR
ncbi:MAG: NUDIX hydrolase [Oscillospiraceae bacterium]|nr:NUDIX hydrolase [Oscillospiraceae bacterium]